MVHTEETKHNTIEQLRWFWDMPFEFVPPNLVAKLRNFFTQEHLNPGLYYRSAGLMSKDSAYWNVIGTQDSIPQIVVFGTKDYLNKALLIHYLVAEPAYQQYRDQLWRAVSCEIKEYAKQHGFLVFYFFSSRSKAIARKVKVMTTLKSTLIVEGVQ